MKTNIQKNKSKISGITLIALVITIIVLLILAGVTIGTLTGDNGVLNKAQEAKSKMEQAQRDEEYALQKVLDEFNYVTPSEEGYNEKENVNSPKITKGMIPIKWNESEGKWEICSENDKDWYEYTNVGKQWANIMLSDGTYKEGTTAKVGTMVKEEELGSMYVWIPRYAYKILEEGTINIKFLKGNTNTDNEGYTYKKATPEVNTEETTIVHPAFTIGAKELTGIWVAKFEMSGKNKAGEAVGNATKEGNGGEYNPVAPDDTTIAKSLPNVPSWRHITIGESEYQSIAIAEQNRDKFGIDYCSSHLIRNSEWGAVAYLCYSQYGNVPQINACGSLNTSWYYDIYTGQGPLTDSNEARYEFDANTIENHGYSTENGILASTTGNITGIYDMNGGSWERVAAYLDNENGNLDAWVKSTSNPTVKYFEGGKLKSEYSSLWEGYEVSEEEKNNQIKVAEGEILSQGQLWGKHGDGYKNNTDENIKYNTARKRLTDKTFDLLAKVKGIGVNEMAKSHSYYGVRPDGNYNWLMDIENTDVQYDEYGRAWDNDYVLIGHASIPFVMRGGNCYNGGGAGVLGSNLAGGGVSNDIGFRSVLVV